MGVFQKVVDTARRTVKKPPQPQSDMNTVSYYQYFLPCQDEDTIQVEDLPGKRSPDFLDAHSMGSRLDSDLHTGTEDTFRSYATAARSNLIGFQSFEKCDEHWHLYDGREVKVGFSPKFDPVEKGIAGFKYCGQTRAHPILLLVRLAFVTSQPDFDCDSFICPPEDKELFRQTLEHAMDIGHFLQEYKSRGDEGEEINSAREDKGDKGRKKGGKKERWEERKVGRKIREERKGRDHDTGKDRGQDSGPSKPGDLPHEGMVIHCIVMEELITPDQHRPPTLLKHSP
ncbi:hypothetical protein F5876DRAFT_69568 [Lentinula aff. lateritia]|uniref:Uncharacterized protein n=1 Tax=Lentinula aff. lateritia TaxID=2804960 RepID=A0ACC1TLX3_9AGAR|nr:hypothetical protein F5876DRAFT_69568 [Lentinula aff. lateritia]